jgi:hypothetical protein
MSTHVLLISQQVLPNLTPLLDPAIKPERVIMLVSQSMIKRADWLKLVLNPAGIKTDITTIEDPYDMHGVRDTVEDLILNNDHLILNATCGTKIMSIAAYEAFRSGDLPIYYVHPESDLLIWLHDRDRQSHQISDRIKLDNFLIAHGAKVSAISRQKPKTNDVDLAEKIIQEVSYFASSVSELNYLAQQSERNLNSPLIADTTIRNLDAFNDLLDIFSSNGYLEQINGGLRFASEDNRFFVNGGWIEHWVYEKVRKLAKSEAAIHDVAYNLQIERNLGRGKPVKNEIDAAFLYNNRLHIIECKTRKLRTGDTVGADTLYKLETLKPIMGGLQARAMLVSLLDVPDKDKTRAAELNITICDGNQLKNLDEVLNKFLS